MLVLQVLVEVRHGIRQIYVEEAIDTSGISIDCCFVNRDQGDRACELGDLSSFPFKVHSSSSSELDAVQEPRVEAAGSNESGGQLAVMMHRKALLRLHQHFVESVATEDSAGEKVAVTLPHRKHLVDCVAHGLIASLSIVDRFTGEGIWCHFWLSE